MCYGDGDVTKIEIALPHALAAPHIYPDEKHSVSREGKRRVEVGVEEN